MTLIFLILGFATAAKPSLCETDWTQQVDRSSAGTFIDRQKVWERALNPGLMRVQMDLCRCLPRMKRNHPDQVRADLHVEPNQGTVRVAYRVDAPHSPPIRRMRSCLGDPELRFEPVQYVSDIILPNGERGKFPHFPIVVHFNDVATTEPNRRTR